MGEGPHTDPGLCPCARYTGLRLRCRCPLPQHRPDRWTVEVVVEHPTHLHSGVPPEVLAALADHDLTVRRVTQQGAESFSVVVATA